MKQYLAILLLMGLVGLGLSSCGSSKGIQANQVKKDLNIAGMQSELANFDPARKVLASDSLYINNVPPADKVFQLRPAKNKKDYILPNGLQKLPLYIYQLKNGTYAPEDYLWAFKAVRDGAEVKVMPLNMNSYATKAKKANKGSGDMAIAGETKSFDFYGSMLKAVVINDTTMVAYRPCLLSIFLTSDLPVKMIHYSYNNLDFKLYDLMNPDDFMSVADRVYVKEINLDYGDRFGLITDDGMTPNISPYQIKTGKISLSGVELIPNDRTDMSYYVFRVLGSGADDTDGYGAVAGDRNRGQISDDKDIYDKIIFGEVSTADLSKYKNGYVRVFIRDIAVNAWDLFVRLAAMKNANGERPVGIASDGKLYPTVIVSPSLIRPYQALYEKYKNKIQYPN